MGESLKEYIHICVCFEVMHQNKEQSDHFYFGCYGKLENKKQVEPFVFLVLFLAFTVNISGRVMIFQSTYTCTIARLKCNVLIYAVADSYYLKQFADLKICLIRLTESKTYSEICNSLQLKTKESISVYLLLSFIFYDKPDMFLLWCITS